MSETRTFALIGSVSTMDLAAPLDDVDGPIGDQDQVTAFLGGEQQQVEVLLFRMAMGGWQYLGGDEIADVVVDIDLQRALSSEAVIAAQQAKLAALYIQNEKIEAGVFEDSDAACYLYWRKGAVVMNCHPYVNDSISMRALRDELDAVGIAYELQSLDPYFRWSRGEAAMP